MIMNAILLCNDIMIQVVIAPGMSLYPDRTTGSSTVRNISDKVCEINMIYYDYNVNMN